MGRNHFINHYISCIDWDNGVKSISGLIAIRHVDIDPSKTVLLSSVCWSFSPAPGASSILKSCMINIFSNDFDAFGHLFANLEDKKVLSIPDLYSDIGLICSIIKLCVSRKSAGIFRWFPLLSLVLKSSTTFLYLLLPQALVIIEEYESLFHWKKLATTNRWIRKTSDRMSEAFSLWQF